MRGKGVVLWVLHPKVSCLNQKCVKYPYVLQIIARVSVDNRTRALVQGLYRASDVKVYINRVEDLSYHLLQFPETCGVAVKVTPQALALFSCFLLISISNASTPMVVI